MLAAAIDTSRARVQERPSVPRHYLHNNQFKCRSVSKKLLVLMTIKLHKTAVTSASKISQPYILLGPLGHTTVPGKEGAMVCVCMCVFWDTRVYLRNGLYS